MLFNKIISDAWSKVLPCNVPSIISSSNKTKHFPLQEPSLQKDKIIGRVSMVCMQIMFGSEEVIEDYPLNPNTAAGLYVCYVIRKQSKFVEGKREKMR